MLRACSNCRKLLAPAASVCPDDASPGTVVELAQVPPGIAERFTVREPFAVGGTGTSFRIVADGQADRLLKLIDAAVVASPAEAARLRRDLHRQSEMRVPSLGRVLEFGIEASVLWVLREFVPGESLAIRMRRPACRTGLPLPTALGIAAQLSAALDELHRAGLLQRDLKAGHVIVEDDGAWSRARLIDAGIADQPALVAPEVAAGQPASFRSDLYALGCVLHQMLSGAVPDGRDFDLDWPKPLAVLLGSLLAHDPNLRPLSAQQVRRTLGSLLPADAPDAIRGSWPAPSVARAGQSGVDASQAAVPKFRAGVGKMSDKTQEISLGEIEAADPQDPPTQELGPADIEAAVKYAESQPKPAAARPSGSLPPAAQIRQRLATKSVSPPPPPAESLLPPAQRRIGDTLRPPAAARPDSIQPPKPSSRPAPPPAAYAHRPSGAPPRSGAPGVAARPGSINAPARPSAASPAIGSRPTAPPPAAGEQATDSSASTAPRTLPKSPVHTDFAKTLAGTGAGLPARSGAESASARARAEGSAPADGATARGADPASPVATADVATPAHASELDSIRDAAARGAVTQRGILQPTAAEASAGRRPAPQISSRKTTELGMPAVKPPAQSASNADSTSASKPPASNTDASESAQIAGDGIRAKTRTAPLSPRDPSLETAPGTLAAVRKAEAGASPASATENEAKSSAARAALITGAGVAAASARRADEVKPASPIVAQGTAADASGSHGPVNASQEALSSTGSDPHAPVKGGAVAGTSATASGSSALLTQSDQKSSTASGPHAPVSASDLSSTPGSHAGDASRAADPRAAAVGAGQPPAAASSPKGGGAADLPLPIPRSSLGAESTTPSAPIAAAQPGASFDVEALFDDKLAPERAVISAPHDPTDPKTKLDRDPAGELAASHAHRSPRPRGMQSWPLLAAAGVLALVAVGLSARTCGSSDEHVATNAVPPNVHVLQPSAEPKAAPPAAAPVPPPSAAPSEPSAPVEQAAAEAPSKQPAVEPAEAKSAPAAEQHDLAAANGKTLTAQQARPLPQSLRGGVVAYRANSDPQIDYKAKGRELFSSGKYKDAADAYQRASLKTPSDAGAFAGLGASWLAAGQPDKAISAYQRALQLKPEASGFQAALGRAYLQKGDRGRAASAYRKALELDPQNSAAKTGLQSVQ
jgi:serine/threonine protein kinase